MQIDHVYTKQLLLRTLLCHPDRSEGESRSGVEGPGSLGSGCLMKEVSLRSLDSVPLYAPRTPLTRKRGFRTAIQGLLVLSPLSADAISLHFARDDKGGVAIIFAQTIMLIEGFIFFERFHSALLCILNSIHSFQT